MGCEKCWDDLALAIGFGSRCSHCGSTPAENKAKKIGNNRPFKKYESERHRTINLRQEKEKRIIGLRPLVGDYWGEPVKTPQNPHACGWGDRYCGIHDKPMTEGFRKGIGKGEYLLKCEDCDFHLLFPPKTKMDMKQVKEVLKPYSL
jgi:DNA-directed RNA polymerase subunit RPC12/RpoP